MISLDDEAALRAADPSGLLDAFATLPRQLREGYELGRAVEVPGDGRPDAVVLCGMGGSAAAADVAVEHASPGSMVPIQVVRNERLPGFVNERTLVICLSYSGETHEALEAADDALGRGARLVVIASGGRLVRAGNSVVLPDTAPTPRAALGWLTGAAWRVLDASGIGFSEEDENESRMILRGPATGAGDPLPAAHDEADALEIVLRSLTPDVPVERNPAKQIASSLEDRIPVIWASWPELAPAAYRWKAAFNENSKMPAFASFLPELTHHEVVGWTKEWGSSFEVIVLRPPGRGSGPSVSRAEARLAGAFELLDAAGINHREVALAEQDEGDPGLLGLMAVGDFASAYHALMRGIDPTPIEAIARIKDKLR